MDEKCVWTILTDTDRRIVLGMNTSVFAIHDQDCLLVYDGLNNSSPVLGDYCNGNYSSFQTVYSTGRYLYIELVSKATEAAAAFVLRYVTFLSGKSMFCKLFFFFLVLCY